MQWKYMPTHRREKKPMSLRRCGLRMRFLCEPTIDSRKKCSTRIGSSLIAMVFWSCSSADWLRAMTLKMVDGAADRVCICSIAIGGILSETDDSAVAEMALFAEC